MNSRNTLGIDWMRCFLPFFSNYGVHHTPKVGCFFKIQLFCCFITQLVKKLKLWALYEVMEIIPPYTADWSCL